MAKYRVKEASFIGNHMKQEGDIVDSSEFAGEPGTNLELVKEKKGEKPEPSDKSE